MNKPKRNPVELEWPQQGSIPGLGEYLEAIPPSYDVEQMRRSFPHLLGAMVKAIEAEVNFHGIQQYWLKQTDGVDVTEPLPQVFGADDEFRAGDLPKGRARGRENPNSMILEGYLSAQTRARYSEWARNSPTYKPLGAARRRLQKNGKARK